MDIDTIRMAGLTTRKVQTVERSGKPATLVAAERTYPTTMDDLWDALTNIDRLPRWFLPVSGDLRPGGRYGLEGNASGEILECDPPHRFEITWEFGGDTSWVVVELEAAGADETRLRLHHIGHIPEELWGQYGPGATGVGWDLGLVGLHLHITSGETLDPDEVRNWETSPNARAFIELSSGSWADASVVFGTDPNSARAAADRVTAFYTGSEA